jgi:hypothetical protein
MTDIDYRVNRTTWPPGPWDDEGDREQWTTASGLPGLIARSRMGMWCGYVAVAADHPYYQRDYADIDDIDVHGGLSYSAACQGHICHVPEPGQPDDVWWLGFDCAHIDDVVPVSARFVWELSALRHCAYRDMVWVRAEVESLAAQLAAVYDTPANT